MDIAISLYFVFACAVISIVITISKLFKGVREYFKNNWFMYNLLSCHFCVNFYVVLFGLLILNPHGGIIVFILQWLCFVFWVTIASSLLIVAIGGAEKF